MKEKENKRVAKFRKLPVEKNKFLRIIRTLVYSKETNILDQSRTSIFGNCVIVSIRTPVICVLKDIRKIAESNKPNLKFVKAV